MWPAEFMSAACESFQKHLTYASPLRMKGTRFTNPVNFASTVKFDKHSLSCDWLRACCMGRHSMLENLQDRSAKNTEW